MFLSKECDEYLEWYSVENFAYHYYFEDDMNILFYYYMEKF